MKSTREGRGGTLARIKTCLARALLRLARGGATLARAPYALATREKRYSFRCPVLYVLCTDLKFESSIVTFVLETD